ncbi:acetylcholine receptor subunit alpha-like [Physella acuta]|uniref:acetylcholine receptor subunit alpha-like n=1 Tax=Physella acuta TaxID=109671 RepID=UPI0027DCDFF3|nr:acetylcholine receptor subunit alpha-like [Physella acuta]
MWMEQCFFVYFLFYASGFHSEFATADANAHDMDRLHKTLFSAYNPLVRPSLNYSKPTDVDANLVVATIIGLDIKKMVLKFSGVMTFQWVDELLMWDPSNYSGIQDMLVLGEMIWRPKVAVANAMTDQNYFKTDGDLVSVQHTGQVRWQPIVNVEVVCEVDVSNYPFDTQSCGMLVSSWMTDNQTINLRPLEPAVECKSFLSSGQFHIQPDTVIEKDYVYDGKHYISLFFRIKLTRQPVYLILTLLIPITLLAFLSLVSFLMSPDEPEKLSVSITVLLSFTVFIGIIDSNLPETSDRISYLVVYVSVLLLISFLGVIGNAVVYVIHRWERATDKHADLNRTANQILPICDLCQSKHTPSPTTKSNPEEVERKTKAVTLTTTFAQKLNNYFIFINSFMIVALISIIIIYAEMH